MKKYISSQRGMTLIEVMVAIGITGVVSLAVMKLNKEMFKTQRTIEQKANRMDMQANFNRLLSDQAVCRASLFNLIATTAPAVSGTNVPSIQSPTNIFYVPDSTGLGTVPKSTIGDGTTSRLIIRTITLGNFEPENAPFNGEDPWTPGTQTTFQLQRGTARVMVTFSKPEDRGAVATNINHSFGKNLTISTKITVVRAVAGPNINRVTDCYVDENQHLLAMCSNLNGFIDETDGSCRQLNIRTLDPASASLPARPQDFSISAWGGLRAANGVYIGNGSNDSTGAAVIRVGNQPGLGVEMNVPGAGEIASYNSIRSHVGDIIASNAQPLDALAAANTATGISVAAGGNVIARNNVLANGMINSGTSMRAGTTVTANGVPSGNSIIAGQGNIVALNGNMQASGHITSTGGNITALAGNVIARGFQQTSNCPGGTVVADSAGNYRCITNTTATCANTYNAGTRVTTIRTFNGYDVAGNVICKATMTFDSSNSCPAGQAMIGYKESNTATGGALVPNCVLPGTGCSGKSITYRKWFPGPSVGDGGYYSNVTLAAIPANICANGYMAPEDNYGFTCPGTVANQELPELQPLAYGCETSTSSDTNKVTRYFTHWTCGEPTPLYAGGTTNSVERPCRLGGNKSYRTYQQCYSYGGRVYFYSTAEASTFSANRLTGYGASTGPQPTMYENLFVAMKLENGKEEQSYCFLPQTNAALTTGRSYGQGLDNCNSSCDPIRAKTLSDSAVNAARNCPAPFVKSSDPQGYYYYEVNSTTCAGATLATSGSTCNYVHLNSARVIGSGSEIWASNVSSGSQWEGTRLGTASSSTTYTGSQAPFSQHYSATPTSPVTGYDTIVIDHVSGGACEDHSTRFHIASFACYAMISGMSCR